MGVLTQTKEISSPVAPSRLFKAMILDSHNLFIKLKPDSFKSIEFVEGDCVAVGAVKQINFPEGSPVKYVKHRIDELDVENFYCKYTATGDIQDSVEYCVHEAKFVASGSGSLSTITVHFHPKGDAVVDEEGVKIGEEKIKAVYEKVEEYLIANPDVYA